MLKLNACGLIKPKRQKVRRVDLNLSPGRLMLGKGDNMGWIEYLQHKLSSAIGGLLGGTSALRFMHAKDMKDAFYRGGISVIFSVAFGIPLLAYLGLPYQNWEWQLASAFVCGFIGYSAMSAAATYVTIYQKKITITRRRNVKLVSASTSRRKKRAK